MGQKSILSWLFGRFRTIRSQLTFTSVVLVAVLVLCILLASFTLLSYFVRQNHQLAANTVEIAGESVQRRIEALRKLVSLVREDSALTAALYAGGDGEGAAQRMSSLYAYGLQQRYLISTREKILNPIYLGNEAQGDNALRLAGFYEYLEDGKEEHFSAPHQFPFRSPDGDRISFFSTLRDPSQRYRVYGYVLLIVSIPSLFEDRQDLIRSRFDDFYVVDGQGRLIFSLRGNQSNRQSRSFVLANAARLAQADSLEDQGHLYFSSAVQSYSDWRIVGVVARGAFSRSVYLIMAVVSLLGVAGVLLVFALSSAITGNVSRPVKELNQAMTVFKSGQLPSKLAISPMAEEMTTLVTGFNTMLDNIQSHLDTIMREQEQKKNAEVTALRYQLQSLQHQINPHFLYNTLNIISFLALDGKSAEIRDFNQSLIALLRATLSDTRDSVSIRSEILFLEAYVGIMAYRYPDQFTVNIRVDDGLWEHPIPKLILQPLVENAMIHGVVPNEGKGLIEVLIEDRDRWINVTVGDDGVGMDPRTLRELLVPRKRFTGIGLANVNDRLKLCYGDESGLVISSEPSMGTVIMFKIRKEIPGSERRSDAATTGIGGG